MRKTAELVEQPLHADGMDASGLGAVAATHAEHMTGHGRAEGVRENLVVEHPGASLQLPHGHLGGKVERGGTERRILLGGQQVGVHDPVVECHQAPQRRGGGVGVKLHLLG